MERRLAAILAADVVGYSRMMGEDEIATLAALRRNRSEVIEPAIARHRGRVVKLIGDGLLAEFASVVEAVDCAAEIQRTMARQNEGLGPRAMVLRIGVHLGDVIDDEHDIYGDGVNIAARLEAIAEPGGVSISRQVHDQVQNKLPLAYRSLGPQRLKNIPEPIEVFAVKGDGIAQPGDLQDINYARTPDGVRLAYAISGRGPPLVKSANWLNHLEYDWESPVWRHTLLGLSRDHTLIRYDARGNGLSDWDVKELALDAWISDLETVVDAAGVQRFPLLGISQGCAVSVAYAVRHPEKVSHLILYGGFPQGANRLDATTRERWKAFGMLMRSEWGNNSPAFRQMFTMQFVPDATKEQMDSFNELQRRSTSGEIAARYMEAVNDIDVSDLLALVKAPTLVMHARGDIMVPFENGQRLAAGIPNARFVTFPGNNHLFQEYEAANERFFDELRLFLAS